jgi:hypothetical protein
VLNLMEGRTMQGMVMVELDRGGQMPMTPRETAVVAKGYLQSQGVSLRS